MKDLDVAIRASLESELGLEYRISDTSERLSKFGKSLNKT